MTDSRPSPISFEEVFTANACRSGTLYHASSLPYPELMIGSVICKLIRPLPKKQNSLSSNQPYSHIRFETNRYSDFKFGVRHGSQSAGRRRFGSIPQ